MSASDGLAKGASFFIMIGIGFYLRTKLTDAAAVKGVQQVIMNALLPAVIFKGLVGISVGRSVIALVVGSAVALVALGAALQVALGAIFPVSVVS